MAQLPKRRKKPRTPHVPPGAVRGHARKETSLSSEEAARQCLVDVETIAQWIAAGRLPAQQTRGGECRIRVDDLRAFMTTHGIRTDLLEEDLGLFPTCWEFWGSIDQTGQTGGCPSTATSCAKCPVYRSRAAVCHEVRPLLPGGTVRAPTCLDCIFFATVRGVERDEL